MPASKRRGKPWVLRLVSQWLFRFQIFLDVARLVWYKTGLLLNYNYYMGTAVAQWLRYCATNRKVAGSIPAGVTVIFHWYKILPIALWTWGRLSLQQKWVPGAFPEGKSCRCVRLTTLPTSWAVVTKSGNLNFLEPSGPLQACNGTAVLYIIMWWKKDFRTQGKHHDAENHHMHHTHTHTYIYIYIILGDRGSTVVKCCATNRKVAGSIPAGVNRFSIDIKSLRSHYGPGVDSASKMTPRSWNM